VFGPPLIAKGRNLIVALDEIGEKDENLSVLLLGKQAGHNRGYRQ